MREVLKFGGSSLDTPEKIKEVAAFIKARKGEIDELVVVVSAMGKTTDHLVGLGEQVGGKLFPLGQAGAITLGEELSAALLSIALNALQVQNTVFTARDIKIHAKGHPLQAIITSIDTAALLKALKSGVAIVTGFQGVDEEGHTLCLGRGGSDTTAVALAAALGAKASIYTDVDGFYCMDPNKYPSAKRYEQLDMFSAIESAKAGAKVLDARCLEIAERKNVPLMVLKSQTAEGTTITSQPLEGYHVCTLSCKNDILFVKISTNLYQKLQPTFKNNNIQPLFITSCGTCVAFAAEKQAFDNISPEFSSKCSVLPASLLVLTGSGLLSHPGFGEKLQNALLRAKIYPLFVTIHPTFFKMVIPVAQAEQAMQAISCEFLL